MNIEAIIEKEKELRSALLKEDREILMELGKYLESVVVYLESKEEVSPEELQDEIKTEKDIHKRASDIFQKATNKEDVEEDVNELIDIVNSLIKK
ncbi:hypothetical protein NEPAR06_1453 [Nematocida parisii]|uniref:Uncharacterized protein n=1 Tax=Nematocida parisii (strain ERTm3) TaxID=935791 RepID=I3EIR1_NEMP3|nr:uncharacterized protein NEPG_01681 [Nematocida parisii ERTm1]EIJ89108.1 hypothetical protein NEQG_00927 [Nematocida parisii ERTm3]KAI5125879.1 hypothetical protein NEPAR08_0215 [Nematocida parisii]EIJ93339.1 hypothetical protein NEPG_01681 [Nematocida parisii ERTm1]KAI5126144.1 hypothetical protein NEPAR03_0316 [Nematocida parisii]KAI5140389.1 hypothetical protein NEPAR04_0221 [Nematocida parisii]|eukprot:XP_013059509.1 hypothetical protein NEPG_01681 [Nematocida parisii ERTm1]